MHKKRVGSDDLVLGRIIRTWGGACAACNSVPWQDGWDGREKGTREYERAIGELTVGANRAGEGQKGKHAVGAELRAGNNGGRGGGADSRWWKLE